MMCLHYEIQSLTFNRGIQCFRDNIVVMGGIIILVLVALPFSQQHELELRKLLHEKRVHRIGDVWDRMPLHALPAYPSGGDNELVPVQPPL